MSSIRWNVVVAPNTVQSVRMYLAGRAICRVLFRAVRAHVLELSEEQAKAANVRVTNTDSHAVVTAAVQWVREHGCMSFWIPMFCSVR